MQAMRVYRLADGPGKSRFYLDGRRVTPGAFENAHFQRMTDTYASRMETRRDGSVIVREYHCIRREGR
jgi:hypothetical protein